MAISKADGAVLLNALKGAGLNVTPEQETAFNAALNVAGGTPTAGVPTAPQVTDPSTGLPVPAPATGDATGATTTSPLPTPGVNVDGAINNNKLSIADQKALDASNEEASQSRLAFNNNESRRQENETNVFKNNEKRVAQVRAMWG
jgi:hypothetical protein